MLSGCVGLLLAPFVFLYYVVMWIFTPATDPTGGWQTLELTRDQKHAREIRQRVQQNSPERVDEVLEQLRRGSLKYRFPEEIEIRSHVNVTAVIEQMPGEAARAGNNQGKELVPVTQRMALRLIPSDELEATLEGDEAKGVKSTGETAWNWKLSGKKAGEGSAVLLATLLLEDTSGPLLPLEIRREKLAIKVTYPFMKRLGDAWDWLYEHVIMVALVALIGGLMAWLLGKIQKTKNAKAASMSDTVIMPVSSARLREVILQREFPIHGTLAFAFGTQDRWIALFEAKPVNAITQIAKISSLQRCTKGWKLLLDEPRKLHLPLNRAKGARRRAFKKVRYTTHAKIMAAKTVDDLF